jgi:hypothetical protein
MACRRNKTKHNSLCSNSVLFSGLLCHDGCPASETEATGYGYVVLLSIFCLDTKESKNQGFVSWRPVYGLQAEQNTTGFAQTVFCFPACFAMTGAPPAKQRPLDTDMFAKVIGWAPLQHFSIAKCFHDRRE